MQESETCNSLQSVAVDSTHCINLLVLISAVGNFDFHCKIRIVLFTYSSVKCKQKFEEAIIASAASLRK